MKMFPVTVEFTFPYKIDGATVAEFDARATASVTDLGAPAHFNPVHGGDPGWGPEWDDYRDIEVASSHYSSFSKRNVYEWHPADEALAARLLAHLNSGAENEAFAEAARMADAAE
jgi:hypothetical protein